MGYPLRSPNCNFLNLIGRYVFVLVSHTCSFEVFLQSHCLQSVVAPTFFNFSWLLLLYLLVLPVGAAIAVPIVAVPQSCFNGITTSVHVHHPFPSLSFPSILSLLLQPLPELESVINVGDTI